MDLLKTLAQTGGLEAMARELNISPDQAQQGATALLPSILGGFTNGGQGSGGLGGLEAILGSLGGGALIDNVVKPEPTPVNKGNDILGQIFGSKEVSREVASRAAPASGLDSSTLKKMLPILAMLVGGYLSKQSSQGGGGLGGVLGSILGGGQQQGGGLGGILGSVLGGGGGGGSPLDDILGSLGKMGR